MKKTPVTSTDIGATCMIGRSSARFVYKGYVKMFDAHIFKPLDGNDKYMPYRKENDIINPGDIGFSDLDYMYKRSVR